MSTQLKQRTKRFALDVMKVCHGLPLGFEVRHTIAQLTRASSSVAANYRSACRGKSRADFISKLGIVEEEADESGFWLELLRDLSGLGIVKLPPASVKELTRLEDEANQLVAIMVSSRKTARAAES